MLIFAKMLKICIIPAENAEITLFCVLRKISLPAGARKVRFLHISAKGAISPKITKEVQKSRNSTLLVEIRLFRPRGAKPYKTNVKIMVLDAHFAKNAKIARFHEIL